MSDIKWLLSISFENTVHVSWKNSNGKTLNLDNIQFY